MSTAAPASSLPVPAIRASGFRTPGFRASGSPPPAGVRAGASSTSGMTATPVSNPDRPSASCGKTRPAAIRSPTGSPCA